MLTVFSKIIVIFAVVAVGFFCNKKGILPNSSEGPLVNLLVLVICPCMILSSLASKTLDSDTLPKTLLVLGLSLGYFVVAPFIAFFFARFMKHTPKEDLGVIMVIMTSTNTGFMGFPVTKSIFGDEIFFLIVVENIILNIYFYSIAIFQINYGHNAKGDLGSSLKSIINPNIIAALIGLIILFGRISLPGPGLEFLDMLGSVTTPLSMLIVGMRLANSNIKSVLKNRDLIFASFIKMFIMPVITFLLVNWLPIPQDVKLLLVWCSCFPTAVIMVSLSSKYKRNATLAAEGIALTTIISLLVLPVAATILSALYL
ncbi:MAG: AEC family transporter [Firmicutes bacterium]|nr:AEC family transporter [Bacillota bacterium]